MDRIENLRAALASALELDRAQEHASAASLLDSAIAESNGDYAGEDERYLLEFRDLVQKCREECNRQEKRQALLNAYLE